MARSATVLKFPDQLGDRLKASLGGPSYGDQTEEKGEDDDDIFAGNKPLSLEKLKKQYSNYLDAKPAEHSEAAEARRYYAGVQWTTEELQKLKERNQPPVTFNRTARKINGIVGLIEKLKQDPKAFPRTPDPAAGQGAELATNVLMYAVDVCNFKDVSPECSRQCSIAGISGIELVITQGDQGDPDISMEPLDSREFFYDPKSTKADFSDARYLGTAKWMDLDVAKELWPDHEEELEGYVDRDQAGDSMWRGDEREPIWWTNYAQKRLRVIDHWYQKGGEWLYCIYCGEYKLEEGPSPFRDEKKKSTSKYYAFSANVDHHNDRYGFCRDLKSPQDEINHRRSKALHLLNTRRIRMENGAVDDVEVLRREAARADGVLVHNKEYELEFLESDSDFQGNVALLAEAKQEMENFGPNPSLMGVQAEGQQGVQSGRAIALLQQAGISELGPFIIAWRGWKRRIYRALWCAIQQFWTQQRWIRVTDDAGLMQMVQVNGWQTDQYGFPAPINQLGALDVDIILDEGPDQVNAMADAFEILVALAQNGAQIPPEAIIELSSLPASVKKLVMAKITQTQQDPMAQQATQLKMQQEAAKLGKIQSETQLNTAKAQQALQPEPGPAQQVDTPADSAKAALDLANARKIALDTAHQAQRGPHADQAHEVAMASAQAQHEATMAHMTAEPPAPPQTKTIQENMLDAAKARVAFAQASKLEAETADPERFHPRPQPKGSSGD